MMIANRRYIFIIVPVVLLLLGAGTVLFYINTQKREAEKEKRGVVLVNAIAVPVDAAAIFCFRNISVMGGAFIDKNSIFSNFINKESPLYTLIESIKKVATDNPSFKVSSDSEALISLHYSAKNDISLLFCLDLSSEAIGKELFRKCIENLYPSRAKRKFNNREIYILDGVQFSIYKNIFIASTSPIVLESSLRHLASGSSILDNRDFSKILKETVREDNLLLINNQQIGKIFSGVIDRKLWGYSDFFSKIGTWTTLKGEFSSNFQRYLGAFANLKGVGNYSTAFNNQEGDKFAVWKILPYNTFGMFTIPLRDYDRFFDPYQEYKEIYKKLDAKNLNVYKDWFLSLEPQEVSTALIPYGGVFKWVTFVKTKTKSQECKIEKFTNKGAIAYLFGEMFSSTEENFYCKRGEWIIIGSEDIVKEYVNDSFPGFTMEEYFSQSDVYGKIMKEATLLSLIINVSVQPGSLAGIFKPVIKDLVSKNSEKRNFEVIAYQLYTAESGVEMNLLFYSEQMAKLPVPIRLVENKPAGWEIDTVIQIPAGPFELVDFISGEREYLEQLPNYKLRLLDKNKKGIWTVPFLTPLRGYVVQVDYYKNKKRQLLFASGNKLYLLDRLGRFVGPFPKSVDSLIILGPKIYNLKNDGDYAIMLLLKGNSLRLYDRVGSPFPAWNDIKTAETIKEFPELINVGENNYWVLRTQVQTIIFTVNGNPVTKFSNRNALLPTTGLHVVSDQEVEVTTKEGKNIILNLENGQIKRIKK